MLIRRRERDLCWTRHGRGEVRIDQQHAVRSSQYTSAHPSVYHLSSAQSVRRRHRVHVMPTESYLSIAFGSSLTMLGPNQLMEREKEVAGKGVREVIRPQCMYCE